MSELQWSWATIAITLIWRLAPRGLVLVPRDLQGPRDRVMLEDRTSSYIGLSFISLGEAHARTHSVNPATSDTVHNDRWKQLTAFVAWKLARNGIRLGEQDREAVPGNLELLMSGHPDGVEYRFLPRAEARAMHAKARDEEGIIITEGMQ